MRVSTRLVLLTAIWLTVGHAEAQPNPPSTWHPYQGGVNCIQVADKDGNFNCSPTSTIDPVTGAVSIPALSTSTGTFLKGVALIPSTNPNLQLLGAGDLYISTSPFTIAPAGPGIAGLILRVRQIAPNRCQLVVAAGNGFQEFVIPVLNPIIPGQPLTSFPGGSLGC